MRQALHIFKKDVRFLWYEIAVVFALVSAFAFVDATRWTGWKFDLWDPLLKFFLTLAWWNLIARVIHAEPLPGHGQFWVTRPYSWKSLLGAKALFILAFVSLPMLVASAVIVAWNGFPVSAHVPGLLWSQFLLTVVIAFPVAALAAVTRNLTQVVVSGLVLSLLVLLVGALASAFAGAPPAWIGLQWIPYSFSLVFLTVTALAILISQYARRRRVTARGVAAGAALLACLGPAFLPWRPAFALQSHLAKQQFDGSSLHIALDSNRKSWSSAGPMNFPYRPDSVRVELPLQLTGVPSGMRVTADAAFAIVYGSSGEQLAGKTPWATWSYEYTGVWQAIQFDRSFFERVKNQPVRIRTSLYLTLLGNRRTASIPIETEPMVVPDVGLCTASPMSPLGAMVCFSAFREPSHMVSTYARDRPMYSLPLSYSPYPAELGISPIRIVAIPINSWEGRRATFVTEEPLAHFQASFEISAVRLADYEAKSETK